MASLMVFAFSQRKSSSCYKRWQDLSCMFVLIQGKLLGYDQTVNLILADAEERIYTNDSDVEIIPQGLHLIRGDSVYIISN